MRHILAHDSYFALLTTLFTRKFHYKSNHGETSLSPSRVDKLLFELILRTDESTQRGRMQPLWNWSARRWRPTPLGAGTEGVSTPVRSVIISDFWYLGTFMPRHRSSGPTIGIRKLRRNQISKRSFKKMLGTEVPKNMPKKFWALYIWQLNIRRLLYKI